ncbi:MAG: tetratricopeptide repeat protein [Rhodobacteraceae bacterium]|nr:tetratricopeptide repeat protein [Paracoccaceae bacterium]
MSHPDSFIDEVTEEVRRDKLFAFFRKYGWIPLLVVILIVGGAAWREYTKAQNAAAAQAFGDAVQSALSQNDPVARSQALQALHAEGNRAAILDFLTAGAAVEAGDTKTATSALDAVAADASLPQSYRDLAALKRVVVAGDTMAADARTAALKPLAEAGRPYRPLAMEQLALIAVEAGDKTGAITQFKAILQEPGVTPGLRRRATAMIVALGGDPAAN